MSLFFQLFFIIITCLDPMLRNSWKCHTGVSTSELNIRLYVLWCKYLQSVCQITRVTVQFLPGFGISGSEDRGRKQSKLPMFDGSITWLRSSHPFYFPWVSLLDQNPFGKHIVILNTSLWEPASVIYKFLLVTWLALISCSHPTWPPLEAKE